MYATLKKGARHAKHGLVLWRMGCNIQVGRQEFSTATAGPKRLGRSSWLLSSASGFQPVCCQPAWPQSIPGIPCLVPKQSAHFSSAAGGNRRSADGGDRAAFDNSEGQSNVLPGIFSDLSRDENPQSRGGFIGTEIVFLGTASSKPTKARSAQAVLLRLQGTQYLVDCGEGTQRQLMRSSFRSLHLDRIFITHLHGDHYWGLPGVLCFLGHKGPTRAPVHIYGPSGLRRWLRDTLTIGRTRLEIKYAVHELMPPGEKPRKNGTDLHSNEIQGKDLFPTADGIWNVHEDEQYIVKAAYMRHTIPCWGFVVSERHRRGKFDPDKALALGVTPEKNKELCKGHAVTSRYNKVVKPEDVTGPPRRGRKIVILGDTCDSHLMLKIGDSPDVLVHEVVLSDGESHLAVERGHSTPTMAGTFARQLNARRLVLTHFSPKSDEPLGTDGKASQFMTGSRRVLDAQYESACAAFKGNVVVSRDFLVVPIPASSEEPVLEDGMQSCNVMETLAANDR